MKWKKKPTKVNRNTEKIEEGFFFREYVGDGESSDGTKFKLATTMNREPMVLIGNRVFILSWKDICRIAEDAGLFDVACEK